VGLECWNAWRGEILPILRPTSFCLGYPKSILFGKDRIRCKQVDSRVGTYRRVGYYNAGSDEGPHRSGVGNNVYNAYVSKLVSISDCQACGPSFYG